jgi:hypothetical protein
MKYNNMKKFILYKIPDLEILKMLQLMLLITGQEILIQIIIALIQKLIFPFPGVGYR